MRAFVLALFALTVALSAAQDPADVALQAAIRREVVDGDLQGAIEQYAAIARSPNHGAAAQAVLRMARCYERLGDDRAAQMYLRIIKDFGEQKEIVVEARTRLAALAANQTPRGSDIGWYNGDWQSGLPGMGNWFLSKQQYSRVYDDFTVPAEGWVVTGVFSNNRMEPATVTRASWEIRKGIAARRNGKIVASGISRASQTELPGPGPVHGDTMIGYKIQVDGLRVMLPAGRYWLSVTPVVAGDSYISATRGRNAVGELNHGSAFYDSSDLEFGFQPAEAVGRQGQFGIATDFSQGVIILTNK